MSDFFTELRRRKIWWVAGVYLAVSWIIVQVVALMEGSFALPAWLDMVVIIILAVGFPLALILAWAQETQAPVRSEPDTPETSATSRALDPKGIAVLPYDNFTEDPAFSHLADGIAEDIITHLAFQNGLEVKSRNSSFQFKGTALDATDVGRQLQVRFILEGSVRVVGENVRVTSQLIDTETNNHIWADHVDEALSEIGVLQDALTDQIAEKTAQSMFAHMRATFATMPEDELPPFGLYLRALGIPLTDKASRDRRRSMLKDAIRKGPEEPEARGALNLIIANDYNMQFSSDPEADRAEVIRQSEELLQLLPSDPRVLSQVSRCYRLIGRFSEAVELARQCNAMSSGRRPRIDLAVATLRAGLLDEAQERLEQLEADALQGDHAIVGDLTSLWVCKGDLEKALHYSDQQILHQAGDFLAWVERANIFVGLDRMDEARDCLARVRRMAPRFSLASAVEGYRRNSGTPESQARQTAGLVALLAEETAQAP